MQNTGTLKKRKRRNLAKVNGLTAMSYDVEYDNFDIQDLYSDSVLGNDFDRPFSQITGSDTRLRMSSSVTRASATFTRVTRNPAFHVPIPEDDWSPDVQKYPTRTNSMTSSVAGDISDRSHFLGSKTMNRLRAILLLGATSGAFPWHWNEKKYKIERWSPKFEKLWKVQWFFVTIQTIFLAFFQFYSFVNRVSGGNKSYREVFMNSFSVYWYICAVYFNVNLYVYKEQIRHYINTMLAFNKKYVDNYLITTDDIEEGGRILINLSIPTNISQVFASVSLFLRMPYQPWYLFSYIYPKPWYWLIPGALQEYVMAGQVITSYILIAWIVVAHANSVEFWVKETHNNADSDNTTDELRHPRVALETYRSLQILCTAFNDCMSPLAIPFVKIHIMTGLIPCGYVLIRSMNQIFVDEFPGILTYPIGVFDCVTAGFAMMTMAAEMFDFATSFLDSWSRTRSKDLRRVLMSCPTLRVKVARYYPITVATTITFFKTTFDFITDCIITFP